MSASELMEFLNTAGFPMGMCIILMLYVKKQTDDARETTSMFMQTLAEYNQKLEMLTEKINRLIEEASK